MSSPSATKPWKLYKEASVMLLVFGLNSASMAETFFQEDFEKGNITSTPNPQWSWKAPISPTNITKGLMLSGDSDMYSVSNTIAFTGEYSWRLNFAGRNNWCNQCGSQEVILTQSDINAGCASVMGGPWNNIIYNKSNGFSTWKILSNTDNLVCFDTTQAVGNTLFNTNGFAEGDAIALPYQCGVNGVVAKRINRRSDCNKAINYLDGVSDANFGYGESISRRFYLYIPSETVLPNTTLKLGYSHYRRDGVKTAYTLKLSVQRGLTLELTAPGGKVTNPFTVQRNKWYYFEEVFTRESSDSANDGKYVLYASPAGLKPQPPVISQTNVTIGSIIDMSIMVIFRILRMLAVTFTLMTCLFLTLTSGQLASLYQILQ